jgi:heme exporter protein B
MLDAIITLTRKEFRLEWRQRSVLGGMLLYVISTVFICYLSMRRIVDQPTWNALFWIVQVFIAVNGIAKSFLQENRGRMLYYYTIADPRAMILSKIMYGLVLMTTLSIIHLGVYSILVGNPVQDFPMFLVAVLLGSLGLASVITMVSAIASKASNNVGLVSILGFPVLIPILMTTIRFSKSAMDGLGWFVAGKFALLLIGLNLLVSALAYLLFPYLWKD